MHSVKDYFFIKSSLENNSISIYDLTGKKVKQFASLSNDSQINISDLNSGLYIIILTDSNENFKIEKLIKL